MNDTLELKPEHKQAFERARDKGKVVMSLDASTRGPNTYDDSVFCGLPIPPNLLNRIIKFFSTDSKKIESDAKITKVQKIKRFLGTNHHFQIAVSILIIIISFLPLLFLDKIGGFGYPSAFLISMFNSLTTFFPGPGIVGVIAMAKAYDPLLIGVAAGAGAALGQITSYYVGRNSKPILEKTRIYKRIDALMQKRWAALVIFIVYLNPILIPFIPIADITGAIAGAARYPFLLYLLLSMAGNIPKHMLYVWGGASVLNYLLSIIHSPLGIGIVVIFSLGILTIGWFLLFRPRKVELVYRLGMIKLARLLRILKSIVKRAQRIKSDPNLTLMIPTPNTFRLAKFWNPLARRRRIIRNGETLSMYIREESAKSINIQMSNKKRRQIVTRYDIPILTRYLKDILTEVEIDERGLVISIKYESEVPSRVIPVIKKGGRPQVEMNLAELDSSQSPKFEEDFIGAVAQAQASLVTKKSFTRREPDFSIGVQQVGAEPEEVAPIRKNPLARFTRFVESAKIKLTQAKIGNSERTKLQIALNRTSTGRIELDKMWRRINRPQNITRLKLPKREEEMLERRYGQRQERLEVINADTYLIPYRCLKGKREAKRMNKVIEALCDILRQGKPEGWPEDKWDSFRKVFLYRQEPDYSSPELAFEKNRTLYYPKENIIALDFNKVVDKNYLFATLPEEILHAQDRERIFYILYNCHIPLIAKALIHNEMVPLMNAMFEHLSRHIGLNLKSLKKINFPGEPFSESYLRADSTTPKEAIARSLSNGAGDFKEGDDPFRYLISKLGYKEAVNLLEQALNIIIEAQSNEEENWQAEFEKSIDALIAAERELPQTQSILKREENRAKERRDVRKIKAAKDKIRQLGNLINKTKEAIAKVCQENVSRVQRYIREKQKLGEIERQEIAQRFLAEAIEIELKRVIEILDEVIECLRELLRLQGRKRGIGQEINKLRQAKSKGKLAELNRQLKTVEAEIEELSNRIQADKERTDELFTRQAGLFISAIARKITSQEIADEVLISFVSSYLKTALESDELPEEGTEFHRSLFQIMAAVQLFGLENKAKSKDAEELSNLYLTKERKYLVSVGFQSIDILRAFLALMATLHYENELIIFNRYWEVLQELVSRDISKLREVLEVSRSQNFEMTLDITYRLLTSSEDFLTQALMAVSPRDESGQANFLIDGDFLGDFYLRLMSFLSVIKEGEEKRKILLAMIIGLTERLMQESINEDKGMMEIPSGYANAGKFLRRIFREDASLEILLLEGLRQDINSFSADRGLKEALELQFFAGLLSKGDSGFLGQERGIIRQEVATLYEKVKDNNLEGYLPHAAKLQPLDDIVLEKILRLFFEELGRIERRERRLDAVLEKLIYFPKDRTESFLFRMLVPLGTIGEFKYKKETISASPNLREDTLKEITRSLLAAYLNKENPEVEARRPLFKDALKRLYEGSVAGNKEIVAKIVTETVEEVSVNQRERNELLGTVGRTGEREGNNKGGMKGRAWVRYLTLIPPLPLLGTIQMSDSEGVRGCNKDGDSEPETTVIPRDIKWGEREGEERWYERDRNKPSREAVVETPSEAEGGANKVVLGSLSPEAVSKIQKDASGVALSATVMSDG